jgi:hypothetical protein
VVIFSQLATYRKRQEDCCERLKAAKLPARILTFPYEAETLNSMNNGTQGLTCAKAAAAFCHSLSSEREASRRKNDPIIFITAWDTANSIVKIVLGDYLGVRISPLAEETDINSITFAPIKRSTFGVLHFCASHYTYRQRVLETAILSSLQAVIIITLHIYKLYCSGLFDTSWPVWSSLPVIGVVITVNLLGRLSAGILSFWLGIELIIWVFQDSPALLFVQKALKYTLLGYFAVCYVHLATMQFEVNRNDRLQWVFIIVGTSAVITKYWPFATVTSVNLQALTLTLAVTITASMVFSAWVHWVWRFISNDRESEMEKKVKMLVQRASNIVPGDPSHFIEYESMTDYMSNFTLQYWAWDLR